MMDRMNLASATRWIAWSMHRLGAALLRKAGLWGLLVALLGACAVTAVVTAELQSRQMRGLASRESFLSKSVPWSPVPVLGSTGSAGGADGRERLRAFDSLLLPHEELPQLIQDVLVIADEAGVKIQRGDYRAEVERDGGFLRYRMNLPTQGRAVAIQRFMRKVLLTQHSMALERVQFKRESIRVGEMEARIQWVVFTTIPAGEPDAIGVAPLSEAKP